MFIDTLTSSMSKKMLCTKNHTQQNTTNARAPQMLKKNS